MSYDRNIYVGEFEKRKILEMYNVKPPAQEYIFEACVTIDGRYYVVHDQVFDMVEQQNIGNIWESLDIFKTIFNNIKLEDQEYIQLKEDINSLPIVEGKETLYDLRDILLNEGFFEDTWVGRQFKSAGQGFADFGKESWKGIKKLGVAISQGDWMEILTLLAKGVRFVVRKLKDAMYSAIGITVDAILVATGIGKVFQWIPWALILSLDVYQLIFNDWPSDEQDSPIWMKFLWLGFDVLGLVSTGAVAKAARWAFKPLQGIKSAEQAAAFVAKNPKMGKIITSILEGISKVPQYLKSALQVLSKKFPAGAKFIQSIMGRINGVMKSLQESLGMFKKSAQSVAKKPTEPLTTAAKIKRGTIAGGTAGGMMYGVDKLVGGDDKIENIWDTAEFSF